VRATLTALLVVVSLVTFAALITFVFWSESLDRQTNRQDEARATAGRLVSTAGQIAFLDGGHLDEVKLINADGTGLISVPAGGHARSLAWSPDGSRLAIEEADGIHLLTLDGSAPTRLTYSGEAPAWAPDGMHLAFATFDRIAIIRADGAGLRELAATNLFKEFNGPYTRASPVLVRWSPDGTLLAFVYRYYHSGGHGNFYDTLALVNADGGAFAVVPLPATAQRAEVTGLHWSADGDSFMCLCRCDERFPESTTLYAFDVGILEAHRIADWRVHRDRESPPAWSPDGKWLAYEALNRARTMTAVLRLADGQAHEFLRGERPEWSPDGTRLAFVMPFPSTLAVMNADGSGLTKLLTLKDNHAVYRLAWRPDKRVGRLH
jgi:Tol biopolymer transport system component